MEHSRDCEFVEVVRAAALTARVRPLHAADVTHADVTEEGMGVTWEALQYAGVLHRAAQREAAEHAQQVCTQVTRDTQATTQRKLYRTKCMDVHWSCCTFVS